jgi:hypothetical protein
MKMSYLRNIIKVHHRKLIAVTIALIAYYVVIVRNPLPDDDRMIDDFNENRSHIEELVRRYRNYPSGPEIDHSRWFKEGDTQELLQKASVDGIGYSAYQPWLPNPYSIETAEKISHEAKNAKSYELFYKYGALIISLSPRNNYRSWHLRYANIWKDLYYIPETPRIEENQLLWPFDKKGEYSSRSRVLSTLDVFPVSWKDFECVYRQIENNWFLRLCNGH